MQWLFAAVFLINKELKAENEARNFESKRKKAAKGIIAKTSVIRKDTSRSYIILALKFIHVGPFQRAILLLTILM